MNSDLQREYDATLIMALDNGNPARAEAIVCDWLAERRQIGPIPYLIDLDGEAAIWVASVSPVEKLAYMGAILEDMAQTGIHLNVRKQMSVWLWHGYDQEDCAAFLRKFGEKAHERA
jgi:hypothetical protein